MWPLFSYYFFLPIFMFILLCCVTYFALSIEWTDLTYISLLIIFCIIEYVMNKKPLTLNLVPGTTKYVEVKLKLKRLNTVNNINKPNK